MYQEQVRLAVSPTPCLSRFAHGPAATVNTIRLLDEDKPPTVLEQVGDGDAAYDLKLLTLEDRPRSEPLLETPSDERNAELSPDGRWLAYESDLSGQMQIYVSSFPNVRDGKVQISNSGGRTPLWAKSGRELFFVNGTSLMAVEGPVDADLRDSEGSDGEGCRSASESGRPADLVVVQEGRGGWSARKRVEVTRRRSVQRCGAALHNPFGVQVCVTVVAGWDPS